MKKHRIYSRYLKRLLDIICSVLALIFLCWVFGIIALLVRIKLGSPVLYTAERIGKDGERFKLYKFRSMTDERDENGKLLPDVVRLTKFGRILRSTSLDELPEVFNIFTGSMSFTGPRPMPVSYKDYFTPEERHRHDVRPGLSGWAQVHGRNSIPWEEKFRLDLWYVDNVSFFVDCKILIDTVLKVVKREDIGQGEKAPESLYIERADWIITEDGALPPDEKEDQI